MPPDIERHELVDMNNAAKGVMPFITTLNQMQKEVYATLADRGKQKDKMIEYRMNELIKTIQTAFEGTPDSPFDKLLQLSRMHDLT